MPRKVLIWSAGLAVARWFAYYFIQANLSHDAQWQLTYIPLWIADLPISVVYFVLRLPIPLPEAVIGPIWWFFVPIIVWRLFARRKSDKNK